MSFLKSTLLACAIVTSFGMTNSFATDNALGIKAGQCCCQECECPRCDCDCGDTCEDSCSK